MGRRGLGFARAVGNHLHRTVEIRALRRRRKQCVRELGELVASQPRGAAARALYEEFPEGQQLLLQTSSIDECILALKPRSELGAPPAAPPEDTPKAVDGTGNGERAKPARTTASSSISRPEIPP